jgi:hypothetical protein
MSRHVPRHARWQQFGPNVYQFGSASARFEKGAWWAWLSYRRQAEPTPEDVLPWQDHCDRLGPFKRPRNAMMAVEEHARILKRRHGATVALEMPGLKE